MTVERSFDAARLNKFLNDEFIYPWVHGSIVGPMDATPLVKDKDNIILLGEHGGMIFVPLQGGIYDFHTFVTKQGRGKWALDMAAATFKWVFTQTDAVELIGRLPHGNIRAKAFTQCLKGTFQFTIPNGWIFDHKIVPADIYSFKVQEWMRDAPGMEDVGEWFHRRLKVEYKIMGKRTALHQDDKVHDRYAGIFIEMVKGGQPFKAAVLYNRWAKISGYQEVQIVNPDPTIVDIREALLLFKDNDFRVMTCQQH